MSWTVEGSGGDARSKISGALRPNPIQLLAALGASLLLWPGLPAQATCLDLLDGKTYRCQIKSDLDQTFSDCFKFVSPGTQNEEFDLVSSTIGNALLCDCKEKGSFASPQFGQANTYHCVTAAGLGFALALDGTIAKPGKKTQGQGINDLGTSYFYRCDVARSCTLPTATGSSAPSSWRP